MYRQLPHTQQALAELNRPVKILESVGHNIGHYGGNFPADGVPADAWADAVSKFGSGCLALAQAFQEYMDGLNVDLDSLRTSGKLTGSQERKLDMMLSHGEFLSTILHELLPYIRTVAADLYRMRASKIFTQSGFGAVKNMMLLFRPRLLAVLNNRESGIAQTTITRHFADAITQFPVPSNANGLFVGFQDCGWPEARLSGGNSSPYKLKHYQWRVDNHQRGVPVGRAAEARDRRKGAAEARERRILAAEAHERRMGAAEARERRMGAAERRMGADEARERRIAAAEARERRTGAAEARERRMEAAEARQSRIRAARDGRTAAERRADEMSKREEMAAERRAEKREKREAMAQQTRARLDAMQARRRRRRVEDEEEE